MTNNNNTSQKPSGQAPAGMGSNPPIYRYKNEDAGDDSVPLPVPFWFNPTTAELFTNNLSLEDDDIIVSSGIKMGTTWVTKTLVSLLYEYDDDGNLISEEVANREKIPGRFGQTYPDALFPTRAEKEKDEYGIYKRIPDGQMYVDNLFGDYVWEDFLKQPRPRMFGSHLFGRRYLPKELFDRKSSSGDGSGEEKGKGRLIVVVRNLKDTLCSLHNFRGTPIDGWLGNEHGPGSFHRYLMLDDCPNAMGSALHWVRESSKAVEDIGKERALVVHYESLILNFGAQLKRINDFLRLPQLTEAKARAIEEACSLKTMRSSQLRTSRLCRKGGTSGWKDVDLDDAHWAVFDKTFNKVLTGVEMVEPMRFFQWKDVPGMPPFSLKDSDLNTDPREWPPHLLVILKEGMIVPDPYFLSKDRPTPTTKFQHPLYSSQPSLKLDETNSDGSPRYHLFVSASCPLASSVCAARALLGLENVVSIDIADGQSGAGWVFLNGASCSPWKESGDGPFWLYEVYQLADPLCTTSISVPILWDTATQQIVSNDSWEIMKLMSDDAGKTDLFVCNDALGVIAKEGLFPEEMTNDIEKMFLHLQNNLINPTENAGMEYLRNGNVETPLVFEARKKVLASLEELEGLLGQKRFLLGNNVTAVDIYLATFLFVLDACYFNAYGLRTAEGYNGSVLTGDRYSNLKAYSREMYRLLKLTLKFASFRHGFRTSQAIACTRQSYSCDALSAKTLPSVLKEEMPNLNEIVATLEEPVGDRPSSP